MVRVSVSFYESGRFLSYKWLRKSIYVGLLLLSGPWIVGNITDSSWHLKKYEIVLPKQIEKWQQASSASYRQDIIVAFINTYQREIVRYISGSKQILADIVLSGDEESTVLDNNYKFF